MIEIYQIYFYDKGMVNADLIIQVNQKLYIKKAELEQRIPSENLLLIPKTSQIDFTKVVGKNIYRERLIELDAICDLVNSGKSNHYLLIQFVQKIEKQIIPYFAKNPRKVGPLKNARMEPLS